MLEYKGYQVLQAENHHIWILKDGKFRMHMQATHAYTDDELRQAVDFMEKHIQPQANSGGIEKSKLGKISKESHDSIQQLLKRIRGR